MIVKMLAREPHNKGSF